MIKEFRKIKFSKLDEVIPAMVIIVMIAISYRISLGLALSFVSFTFIKVVSGRFKEVKPAMWVIAILSTLFLIVDYYGDVVGYLKTLI